MPATPHSEKHFTATATVRDIVIGMADGLTVRLPWRRIVGCGGFVRFSSYGGIGGNRRRLDRDGAGRISRGQDRS